MSFFKKLKNTFTSNKDSSTYKNGLNKTKLSFTDKLKNLAIGYKGVDDDFLEELLILLLESDVGIKTSEKLLAQLQKKINENKLSEFNDVIDALVELIASNYTSYVEKENDSDIKVILMVGVNGSGKTTSSAKLANYYKNNNYKVALAAADTFRAGATAQLNMWAKKIEVDCIKGNDKQDPSSVIVDACRFVKENNNNLLICDTAGRLQNKVNLMSELEKMHRVIGKEIANEPSTTLLVLDATTGQNGITQAQEFLQATKVDGIILTKLDGSAKGGIVLAINDILQIPVAYIGLGEGIDDLKEFDINTYLYSMFEGVLDEEN